MEGAGMSDLVKTTITLPDDLRREARAKAIREGKNLSLVVRELLREYIKEDTQLEPEKEG
jgi:metal-responsive CopG/Arc/MetJ family transcriptional regulator